MSEDDRKERVNHLGFGDRQWIGRFFRDRRRALKRRLIDVADAAGLDQGYLSRIERGLANPSYDVVWRLASVLQIDADELNAANREANELYHRFETWIDRLNISDASRKDLLSVDLTTCAALVLAFESLAAPAKPESHP